MVETLRAAPGVGLAAPQVDIPLRLIVVEFGDEEEEMRPPRPSCTPCSIRRSPAIREKRWSVQKAALSVPNLIGDVERFESITIKGLNRHGQPVKLKASDWLARIFQHEIDHLNGILFTDLASQVWEPVTDEEKALID